MDDSLNLIPVTLSEYVKSLFKIMKMLHLTNNPTFDVVNDVNQDFSLKYSNNKMGINDVINKLITHALIYCIKN
jgi:hypothetical protein